MIMIESQTLTISILSIAKGRRHCDDASLSNTHSQKSLIHTSNQPADPDVGVIGAHAGVTTAKSEEHVLQVRICTVDEVIEGILRDEPGIKQGPVQKGAVVMVSNEVGNLHLSGADGGGVVSVDLDAVLCVPHIEQKNVKVEDGVGRDEVTCRGEQNRSCI